MKILIRQSAYKHIEKRARIKEKQLKIRDIRNQPSVKEVQLKIQEEYHNV